ncbi:hypothetical protein GH5_06699 [Leishmania sp. Ghana 2012 LV757]|uniref:hypothetical protein n=1 Tax=Leishmania sp. Ghana 2012 LV757 TaxID=2803181 RepID=UPI001B529A17|nr:hypothetical protein JIQ42_06787 [Leishmania sp. Namibia]KAG5510499.1 hypothetical protein GH5_06699 [Leishmania sp. Ghana 2012 LV757]
MSANSDRQRHFCVSLTNLDGKLETVGGVTYPHHIFGSNLALRSEEGELLLPGVHGEVHVKEGCRYIVEHVRPR